MWALVATSQTWTNLGGSTTFAGEYYVVDLTNFTQVKSLCYVETAGSSGTIMTISYQEDGGGFAALTDSIAIDSTGKQESDYTESGCILPQWHRK